jgi:hypothetical protein
MSTSRRLGAALVWGLALSTASAAAATSASPPAPAMSRASAHQIMTEYRLVEKPGPVTRFFARRASRKERAVIALDVRSRAARHTDADLEEAEARIVESKQDAKRAVGNPIAMRTAQADFRYAVAEANDAADRHREALTDHRGAPTGNPRKAEAAFAKAAPWTQGIVAVGLRMRLARAEGALAALERRGSQAGSKQPTRAELDDARATVNAARTALERHLVKRGWPKTTAG